MLRATGELIGRCGVDPGADAPGRYGDLAWMLARAYWGRGLGTEIGRALVAYAFGPLGLRRLVATAHPDNAASLAVMRELGMRHVRSTPEQVVYALDALDAPPRGAPCRRSCGA